MKFWICFLAVTACLAAIPMKAQASGSHDARGIIANCPSRMIKVQNGAGIYCIDANAKPATDLDSARAKCEGRARLCSLDEWKGACKQGRFATRAWEWVSDIYLPGSTFYVILAGGPGGCGVLHSDQNAIPQGGLGFRCCL